MGTEPAGWFVYVLRCADGTLYTGITTDTARRLAQHNAGTASKYTRVRRPVAIVFTEPHPDRGAASKREAAIKALRRGEKLALFAPPPPEDCPSPVERRKTVACVLPRIRRKIGKSVFHCNGTEV